MTETELKVVALLERILAELVKLNAPLKSSPVSLTDHRCIGCGNLVPNGMQCTNCLRFTLEE